jgi:hypothetical protein
MKPAGPHMLSLEAQLAAYSWRGVSQLTLAATIATSVLVGLPLLAFHNWTEYLHFLAADKYPVLFFSTLPIAT